MVQRKLTQRSFFIINEILKMAKNIEFQLPEAIKDFVFDLNDATRRSMRIEEVEPLYDVKFKEITDKFFATSAWPEPAAIAGECGEDAVFLLLYRELTLRHAITKLKPQLIDHIEAWNNYCKLFHYLQHNTNAEMVISTQWACDMISEFVYQFQGFCQYRTSINNKNEDEVSILENNPDLWSVGIVSRILSDLVRVGKAVPVQQKGNSIHQLLGYFSMIELARLECLLCDYNASLIVSQPLILHLQPTGAQDAGASVCGCDFNLYAAIPLCHINVYYHAGVCLLMLHRYSDALRTFNEIILHISQRLMKQGNIVGGRPGTQQQLQRMLDRMLALAGLCMVLYPCVYTSSSSSASASRQRVEVLNDQVREMIESNQQVGDKYRQMLSGGSDSLAAFENTFESNTPKFISPAIPNYHRKRAEEDDDDEPVSGGKAATSQASNYLCHDVNRTQMTIFTRQVKQQLAVLKLRSYLRLYSTISLEKLTRYDNCSSTDEMLSKLMSYKNKGMEVQAGLMPVSGAANSNTTPNATALDVKFRVEGDNLIIDNTSAQTQSATNVPAARRVLPNVGYYENIFAANIAAQQNLVSEIESSFEKYGL